MPNTFIQLTRTFHELAKSARETETFDLNQAFLTGPSLQWQDLKTGWRTIILSEAGAGKTVEIREAARRLRAEGNRAFFLRLEHVPHDFEDAFEVGTFEEFNDWGSSLDEGWFLLDSVDEARLRSPGDFDLAMRKLGRKIGAALDRAHIIVTGRASAWRATTDLELCDRYFPIAPTTIRVVMSEPPSELEADEPPELGAVDTELSPGEKASSGFRIVALDDLSEGQIKAFAEARGVEDTRAFLDDIERAEAQSFASRPQDLDELVEFWTQNGRLGSRLELMQNSVCRRLEERDQNHREVCPLSSERVRQGVQLLAAASILGKDQTIQVPDGSHNNKGIAARLVLPDWDDAQLQALLSRPIFDEAIYGTVRFHHRSVREFLTAEWLKVLLQKSTSRRQVEALVFREQYGLRVIVPTMRPVLPWLSIFDDRIREQVLRLEPELLFEGGDPTALPLSTRKEILADVCSELASGRSRRRGFDYTSVGRFVTAELAEDIRALLLAYFANADVVSLLIRMVWIGRIGALKEEVKAFALSSETDRYSRIVAIRALRAVANPRDIEELQEKFISEGLLLRRDWLSEIVTALQPSAVTVSWLLKALMKVEPKERYSTDSLAEAVRRFVELAPEELLPAIADGLNGLLEEPPFIEEGFCKVSEGNTWIIQPAVIAVERLIKGHIAEAFDRPALAILHKIYKLRSFGGHASEVKTEVDSLVPIWKELNWAVFWSEVKMSREEDPYKSGERRLVDFRHVSVFGSCWRFSEDDFSYAVDAIRTSERQDDKVVALTLAFDLYQKANCPEVLLNEIREQVSGDLELEERLAQLLDPPESAHRREQKKWEKRAAAREKGERIALDRAKVFLSSHLEELRNPGFSDPSDVSSAQGYLNQCLRDKRDDSGRWGGDRWRELEPDFGIEVAKAYRDGAVSFWRKSQPQLRSEGAAANITPISVIFGLAGLNIEAAETTGWPSGLDGHDVATACRYAILELNGFPLWFPNISEKQAGIVCPIIYKEIEYEIASAKPDEESHYILGKICWSGQWAWDGLALSIMKLLQAQDVGNILNLGKLLTIIQGAASIKDEELATLAQMRAETSVNTGSAATWFAAWVGVEPEKAIISVEAYISSLKTPADQTQFAMMFVTKLMGERLSGFQRVRQQFCTARYLKELFLLMQTYVREDEDINRAGGGVYSPGLRDNAQDARNQLFNQLRQIPGKEAFIALSEIAQQHPAAEVKPWLFSHAKNRAEQDADLDSWSPEKVREFHVHLDRTPTNHRELADLVVLRFLDMKDDLENGDDSVARILQKVEEEADMRNYLSRELREKAHGRYTVTQEEEFADAKRPDLRFHGAGFDAPVPAELKLAERWTGPKLLERLENQLSGDYLRDNRSARGIFVLVNRDNSRHWQVPSGDKVDFNGLVLALRAHWASIASKHIHVEELTVIGIDLLKRFE